MKRICDKKGSTLIEVLTSMIVVAITALGGMALYFNSAQIQKIALHKKIAIENANSQMEKYRTNPGLITPGTPMPFTTDIGTGVASASVISESSQTYYQLHIDVDWNELGNVNRNFNVGLFSFVKP